MTPRWRIDIIHVWWETCLVLVVHTPAGLEPRAATVATLTDEVLDDRRGFARLLRSTRREASQWRREHLPEYSNPAWLEVT